MVCEVLRNQMKWSRYKVKTMNTNHSKGQKHFRSPSKMLWKAIRGMMPYKTQRGQAALGRLQVFEGIPEDFVGTKRMVVPNALKVLHSKTHRKTTLLGRLSTECGWKHSELVGKLEAARIAKGAAYFATKKEEAKLRAKAVATADVGALNKTLSSFGYYIEPTAVGAMKALKEEFRSSLESAPATSAAAEEKPAAAAGGKAAKGGGDY
jgi:large subunit ribosomal protein L13Ae